MTLVRYATLVLGRIGLRGPSGAVTAPFPIGSTYSPATAFYMTFTEACPYRSL
jgi:hypothetical protein